MLKEELIRRYDLLLKCNKDPKLRALEFQMCRYNVEHFINNWCWTFDPRENISNLPFTLYDYQKEALKWLDDRYNNKEVGVIEKSRDMGATWIVVVWALHKWIFDKGFTCLFGSKTEAAVDSQSIDSIFGKIRYLIYKLPQFLRPDMKVKISEGKRDADSYLSIINPENHNELSGDSANSNFGRSGRRSIVFLDEAAYLEQSDRIWASVSEVANVIIPVSTPNGKGNMFYELRSKGTVPVLSLHWSQHPKKDKQWYEDKKKHMHDWQIGSELDLSYDNSKSGKVYKNFKRELHVSKEIIYAEPAFEHFCTLDFGIRDATVLIAGQIDIHGAVEIFGEFSITEFDIELFIYLIKGEKPPAHLWHLLSDIDRKKIANLGKKMFFDGSGNMLDLKRTIYGDHAGTARSSNNKRSVKDRLLSEGNIRLHTTSRQDYANRIQCLGNLFKLKENIVDGSMSSRFKVSPDCPLVIDSLNNYVWAGEPDSANQKPKHDIFSHAVTALEFFAIQRFPVAKTGSASVERIR